MTARSLVELVRRGADRAGGARPAVLGGDDRLDFATLLAGARGVAAALHGAGIGRGDRVGVWMNKSPRCVEAILGIMTSGAAYVPLDPRSPWRRCRTIAADCSLAGLVLDHPRLSHLHAVVEGIAPRLVIADSGAHEAAAIAQGPAGRLQVEAFESTRDRQLPDLADPRPTDIAYILYTSGSTGVPKGVVHTHASGVAFAGWVIDRFSIDREDIFSAHAPFHFDLSISDLYASLGSGASVRLISATESMLAPYLVDSVATWGITVWYSVPSILVGMLDAGRLEERGFGRVRLLFFAGEVFPTPQLRRLRRALPGVRLVNLFGPTETNVCTYYEVPSVLPDDSNTPIPIGRACEHMETFVIDDAGREAAVGEEGTLWVRGANLMQGYWNDAARTATALQPDPRGREGLACCTGDRVVLEEDGHYRFHGRRDHMIKVRGHRIELGEIESALSSHPDVLEAVAVPLPDRSAGHRIVAVALARSSRSVDPAALRAHCGKVLPLYMVPERIEVRSSLPRTSTGKIDRPALRAEWSGEESP